MNAERILLIAILIAVTTQALTGQDPFGGLQLEFEDEPLDGYEWRMFGAGVSGTGGADDYRGTGVYGPTFLYSQRTGQVYRVFTDCGSQGQDGCLSPLPRLE